MDKILIIDDNADLRDNFAEMLGLHNFEVHLATDGLSGLLIAKQQKPDLILCDILMPGMDGFEVFCKLKTADETKYIPFIFLTALEEGVYRSKGLDAGADDFISKSISEEDLISVISCRIRKSKEIVANLTEEKLRYVKELQKLLADISHSVRSPLCTNLGLINILQLKNKITSSDDEISKIVEGIRNSTLRLDDYTKDFTKQLNALVARTNNTIPLKDSDKDHKPA